MNSDISALGSDTAEAPMADEDFAALAGFRLALRRFLGFSEVAVTSAGVTVQQYQAMLAIRAHEGRELSVKELAGELMLRPNGAVQLVDRLEAAGHARRRSSPLDRRSVLVSLTPLGDRIISVLASEHASELARQRPLLVESLRRLKSIAG